MSGVDVSDGAGSDADSLLQSLRGQVAELRAEGLRQTELLAKLGDSEAAKAAALAAHPEASKTRNVILVGDIHGNAAALRALWKQLGAVLGAAAFAEATVIFLGDYCDRGPDTKGVLDFLTHVKLIWPGRVHFIAGNHDLGMAAFLGCLPIDADHPPIDLDATKDPSFESGFWPHPVEGGMHYQGRRWAEGKVYKCASTFKSYGVDFEEGMPADARDKLLAAVPRAHKEFLASLQWIHEEECDGDGWGEGTRRLMCVHAGLASEKPLEPQLTALRKRDLTSEAILSPNGKGGVDRARVSPLIDRAEILGMHPELHGTLLISGHHGISYREGRRIVLDRSGGKVADDVPLEALILPRGTVVGHDGSTRTLTSDWVGTNVENNMKQLKKMAEKKKAAVS